MLEDNIEQVHPSKYRTLNLLNEGNSFFNEEISQSISRGTVIKLEVIKWEYGGGDWCRFEWKITQGGKSLRENLIEGLKAEINQKSFETLKLRIINAGMEVNVNSDEVYIKCAELLAGLQRERLNKQLNASIKPQISSATFQSAREA